MNISIDIRLDLSPALAAAIQDLTRALGGRGLPPLRPYEKPDAFSGFGHPTSPDRPAATPAEAAIRIDTVADIETRTEPKAEAAPEAKVEGLRWSEERKALLRKEYSVSTDLHGLHQRLNALPGVAIPYEIMRWWANSNGLANPSRRGSNPRVSAAVVSDVAIPSAPEIVAKPVVPPVVEKPNLTPPPPPAPPASPAPAAFVQVAPKLQGEAITADDATIRHWAAQRGLCNGGELLDLDRVNGKRVALGLPPYRRLNGLAVSAATFRSAAAGDAR